MGGSLLDYLEKHDIVLGSEFLCHIQSSFLRHSEEGCPRAFTVRDSKIVLLRAFSIFMLMKISHARGIRKRSKEQESLGSWTQ